MNSRTAWAGVCGLVLVAPFEGVAPLTVLPGQSVSTVEVAIACAIAAWLASLLWARQWPAWRTPLTVAGAIFLAAMFVAAIAAPVHRANAMAMAGRFAAAAGIFLLTINGVTTPARVRGVFVAAAVSGFVISALIVAEYFGLPAVSAMLGFFRERTTVIGPQVRAAGPFQYPTIASMYLEIVFAFVLALLAMAFDARRRTLSVVLFALLVLIAQAITFTFTRAGLVTMVSSMAIVGWLRYRRRAFDGSVKAIAALAIVVALQIFATRPAESVMLRMITEGQQSWYGARIEAPQQLDLTAGAIVPIQVRVTNTGRVTWDPADPAPFLLSYHWLAEDGERVVEFEGVRTAFPSVVSPGDTVAVAAGVKAPNLPGRYRLLWDVVIERRLWFGLDPGAPRFISNVIVTGSPAGPPPVSRVTRMPRAIPVPSRLTLWRAAMRMVGAHPLFGVGPDNFRLVYGEYAGLSSFDTRAHSHNMYLEMLAAGGAIGGLAFAWLCVSAATTCARALRHSAPQTAAAAAGIAAAVVAIGLHGLVDSFLGFTGTYVLIAVTLGLASVYCPAATAGRGQVIATTHGVGGL